MTTLESALRSPDPREALALSTIETAPPSEYPDLRALHLDFSSRGDRVPARLLLPPEADGDGPFPLVLLQHGARGAKDAPYIEATGGPWARRGAAVLAMDLPLHGARTSPKLTQLLLDGIGQGFGFTDAAPASSTTRDLVVEFARQSIHDLGRALDAAATLPQIDSERCVYASFSLGTILGATFCALDPRPRAAAFAIGGGGSGPPGLDPAEHIGRFAPRPVLFVNATRDETISRSAAEKLHASAGEPKRVFWVDATHSELPGAALKEMWQFLEPHLGLRAVEARQPSTVLS